MDTKKHVMIPGPTPVVKSIQDQMGREMQAFTDPRFVRDYKELTANLMELVNCKGHTFPLAGSGTLAMEMSVSNVTKRGDDVLVISHGFFGDRFIKICRRKGLNADVLEAEWGQAIPPEEIRAKLKSKGYAAIMVTHVDTSTGVAAPIEDIGRVIKDFPNTVYIVDGVAATAGEYEDMDAMNIDVLFTATQKAFGVSPGMFVLWAGEKALARRKSLGEIPEFYADFENWLPIMETPPKYFATPPVSLIWALGEAARIVMEEGYKARYERHLKNGRAMQAACEALGFKLLAHKDYRAVTLSTLLYPEENFDDAKYRAILFEEGISVAGGLGPYTGKMMRIGHMGNIDINDGAAGISAIERGLYRMGRKDALGKGLCVYQEQMMK